ncbi:ABC transporter permease [bacterium]|nr:ABC transporter permease [bacterium]
MNHPPKIAQWILSKTSREHNRIAVLGDFEELFYEIVENEKVSQARIWYWRQSFESIPGFASSFIYWSHTMIKNYIKVAIRNLRKQKGYFILNLIGLSIGMACCLLIALYVQHELSFDNFHENADRIYRLQGSIRFGGIDGEFAVSGMPAGPAMVDDFPEVESAVRFRTYGTTFVRYENKIFKENRIAFVDNSIFDVFSFPLILGDPQAALVYPSSVAISEAMADKYFGQEDPIGKTINFDNDMDLRVTGVFKDFPDNSHMQFDFLASFNTLPNVPIWLSFNYYTYVLLKKNVDVQALTDKFPQMIQKYFGPEFQQFMGKSMDEVLSVGNRLDFYLKPLKTIHLYSNVDADIAPQGDIRYVTIFSAVAIFILIIACVNFMNLATARSTKRAMEVGLRKVVGSTRLQLIAQFLTESLIISILALFIAIGLAAAALPQFNNISGKALDIALLLQPTILLAFISIFLFTGLGAGLYPAFFLSSFSPLSILKERTQSHGRGRALRSILVVFQFTLAIVLMISTFIVYRQLNFIQNKNIGYDKEQVLLIKDAYILNAQTQTFKEAILEYSGVENATMTSFLPVPSSRSSSAVFPEGQTDSKTTPIQIWQIDTDYFATLNIEIIKGRNFNKRMASDSASVIMNESAVRHFEWHDPIGKKLGTFISFNPPKQAIFTVIGVVKDFHFQSLRNQVEPMVMFLNESNGYLAIKMKTNNIPDLVDKIRALWDELAPNQPFEYSFMDDSFDSVYRVEMRSGRLFTIAASMAIIIGCLGLLGLAAFTAEQKTKEIGIRKVLGASVGSVILLLSRSFTKWVVVASVISFPLAWYLMRKWLDGFAFRVDLEIWVFLAAGLLTLVIAILTVAIQAVKAALANPARSLKYE